MIFRKFRIVEGYRKNFRVQSWFLFFPIWMDAWEECMYSSLEEAQKELEDYKQQLRFKRRVVG